MTASESNQAGDESLSLETADLAHLGLKVPEEWNEWLVDAALERTGRDGLVTKSELVREALAEHYDLPEIDGGEPDG